MNKHINASADPTIIAENAITSFEAPRDTEHISMDWLKYVATTGDFHSVHSVPEAVSARVPAGGASSHSVHSIQDLPGFEFKKLDLSFFELPLFPTHCLPDVIANMVRDAAKITKTEEALAAGVALAVLSACARGNWKVKRGEHPEPLIIWTLPALATGSLKSPVFVRLTEPVRNWEGQQQKKYKNAENELKAKKRLAEIQISAIQQQIKEQAISDDDAIQQLAAQEAILAEVVPSSQFLASNITTETLFRKMERTGGDVAVIGDEGGQFPIMMGLYSKGQPNYDIYLDGYSNTPTKFERGNADINLRNPAVTICICVQPTILQNLSKGDTQQTGLLARFLFLLPQSTVGRRNVREKHSSDQLAQRRYTELIDNLLAIIPNRTDEGERTSFDISITEEAEEVFYDFWQPIESEQGEGGMYHQIVDWTAKSHGQLLRIAGLLHLAEHKIKAASIPINESTMKKAVEIMRFFLAHALAAYDLMGLAKRNQHVGLVIDYLRENKSELLNEKTIHDMTVFKNKTKEDLEPIFRTLEYYGVIGPRIKKKNPKGPPSNMRAINPELFKTPVLLD